MQRSDFIYELKDIITEHSITLEQAYYCLCAVHNIEYEISAADMIPLYQKGLFKNNKINTKVLFRSRETPEQVQLETTFEGTPPKSSPTNLETALRLESRLVIDSRLTDEYREEIAQKYFKGDKTVARYFIIFRSIFPVKDAKINAKWNRHFRYKYEGITLWDTHVRVTKKFHELYRKEDIGLLIAGTYLYAHDVICPDEETCWMTKPYKFLANHAQWTEMAESLAKSNGAVKPKSTKSL
jgi:hypothetical protein